MWRVFTRPVTRCGAETSALQRPVHPDLLSVVQTGVHQESRAPRPGHHAGPCLHTPVAHPRLKSVTNTRVLMWRRSQTFSAPQVSNWIAIFYQRKYFPPCKYYLSVRFFRHVRLSYSICPSLKRNGTLRCLAGDDTKVGVKRKHSEPGALSKTQKHIP